MKKYLITGGSGFIGTNYVQYLLAKGLEVINLDRARPLRESHIPFWREVDILDFKNLESQIKAFSPDVIIHLAAVTDLNGKTSKYYEANVQGTQNIITIAADLPSLKKVIYTSSMYVCKPGYVPKNYNDYKPHTPYGQSKVDGELLVKKITDAKYQWVIVRPTSIWGSWFGIPYIDFFKIVYQGKYFDFGNTCTKTYGYVENTIHQIQKLVDSEAVQGKTFYLGDQPPIQISEWADEISVEMGKGHIKKIPFFVMKTAALAGDVLAAFKVKFPITSFRLANMTTNNILPLDDLYSITGTPPVSRNEGVKRTIAWLVEVKGYQLNSK
jgi:GlcNAc-P-P-Und epimerase